MIEYDGEKYLTVSEVAKRFNISRGTCSTNLLSQVQQCCLPGRKRTLYRLSDVEQFAHVRVVANVPCRMLPASPCPTTDPKETESNVTRTLTPVQRNAAGRAIIAHLPATHKHRKDA